MAHRNWINNWENIQLIAPQTKHLVVHTNLGIIGINKALLLTLQENAHKIPQIPAWTTNIRIMRGTDVGLERRENEKKIKESDHWAANSYVWVSDISQNSL